MYTIPEHPNINTREDYSKYFKEMYSAAWGRSHSECSGIIYIFGTPSNLNTSHVNLQPDGVCKISAIELFRSDLL